MNEKFEIKKKRLSIAEAVDFVNSCADDYFDVDDNGEYYDPFFGDLSVKINFLIFYCGYVIEGKNTDEIYNDAVDVNPKNFVNDIDIEQFTDIERAITMKVDSRLRIMETRKSDVLSDLLNVVTNKLSEIDLSGINSDELNKVLKKFNDGTFSRQAAQVYNKMDKHDRKMVNVIQEKNKQIRDLQDKLDDKWKSDTESGKVVSINKVSEDKD